MNLSFRARNSAIALGLALVAALFITMLAKKGSSSGSSIGKELASVFVATRDIPAGTPGTDLGGRMRTESLPRDDVVPGAISSRTQVRSLVSTERIYAGEQVTARRFQPVAEQGLKGQISGNQRAIAVPGDPNQLLVGTLQQGDHVDVVGNIKYKLVSFRQNRNSSSNDASQEFVATRVVLRNLKVLRAPETPPGANKFSGNPTYTVILALTDNQAQKLFYVMKNGDWSLQLRPGIGAADSPESVETTGSILSDGLRGYQYRGLVLGQ
jgi:Flp pilus assembly protein CpaB